MGPKRATAYPSAPGNPEWDSRDPGNPAHGIESAQRRASTPPRLLDLRTDHLRSRVRDRPRGKRCSSLLRAEHSAEATEQRRLRPAGANSRWPGRQPRPSPSGCNHGISCPLSSQTSLGVCLNRQSSPGALGPLGSAACVRMLPLDSTWHITLLRRPARTQQSRRGQRGYHYRNRTQPGTAQLLVVLAPACTWRSRDGQSG